MEDGKKRQLGLVCKVRLFKKQKKRKYYNKEKNKYLKKEPEDTLLLNMYN